MVKKGFWLWIFPPDVVPFQSKEVVGAFLAHGRQYRRMGLVYFVTSPQCFIHARNKRKHREIALFFTQCLIRVLFLDDTTKVTQKMAELCPEYPVFTVITRSEGEEGKKMDRFCNLSRLKLVPWSNETLR